MDPDLDPATRDQIRSISAETNRLIRLTSNLLYMAFADTGRQPDFRPVDVDVLCLEVVRQLKDLKPDVNLTLGNEDQVTIMGDRDLLKQMLLNLVENGLKYTQSGGRVSLSIHQDTDSVRIQVADTGQGIPTESLAHIFERFYRAPGSAGRGGAGIGLSLVQWIAQSHRGRVDVESQPGRGTTFTVVPPLGS